MRRAIFLLGASGVGKTTVARALLGSALRCDGRWTIGTRAAAAGSYGGSVLDGADTLPRSRSVVEAMLERMEAELPLGLPVLWDGQMGADWALAYLRGRCNRVAVLLTCPCGVLKARRTARGSPPMSDASYAAQAARWDRLSQSADRRVVVSTDRAVSIVIADVRSVT